MDKGRLRIDWRGLKGLFEGLGYLEFRFVQDKGVS